MALQTNLAATDSNNSYRENIINAYFKIEGVYIDTNKETVRIQVRGWLSEYARHNQGIGIYKRVFYAPLEDFIGGIKIKTAGAKDALIVKAYEFLRTLPEFAESKNTFKEYKGPVDITEEVVKEQKESLVELITKLDK